MEQDGHIEQNYFLAALEDGGTFSADYRVVYGRPDVIPAKNEAGAANRELARFVSGKYAAPKTGAELVSRLLRDYTDEWLEKGFDQEGRECPFLRKLTLTPTAFNAVRDYDRRSGEAVDWDDGLKRSPVSLTDRLQISAPRDKASVVPLLPVHWVPPIASSLTGSSPSATSFAPSAVPDSSAAKLLKKHWNAKDARRKAKEKPVVATPEHPNMPHDVVSAACRRAAILFHALMKAPWRYRLGKCKRCQTYFVLKVNPSKLPYARGMHCPGCKNVASAEASGKTKRADREQKLLSLAASVWSSWRPTPQFGERNVWVAKQVSNLVGEQKAIQRNWVTRHEKEIIAMQRKNRESTNDSGTEKLTGQINRFRGPAQKLRRGNALA